MGKKLYFFAIFTTSIMAVLGIVVFTTTIHELIHYKDLKDKGAIVTDICVFNIPIESRMMGYVNWQTDSVELASLKSPELMPYFVTFFSFGVLAWLGMYVIVITNEKLKGVRR